MVTTSTGTTTSRDGTNIAYDRYGAGPPLIIVDGATVIRGYDTSLATALAPRFTVFAFDRRGRANSTDTPPYAVEREDEDLVTVIREAGSSVFVLGFSSGAVLALRSAADGVPMAKLAVYEPPFIVDDSRPPLPDDYVERLDALVAEGRRGDAYAYFMTAAVGMPQKMVDGMHDEPFWPAMEAVAHTIAYDGRIMGDIMSGKPLTPEPWSSIAIPTLVMAGGSSPEFIRAGAEQLAAAIPNAEYRILAGQDHGPADDVLAPVLVAFFST